MISSYRRSFSLLFLTHSSYLHLITFSAHHLLNSFVLMASRLTMIRLCMLCFAWCYITFGDASLVSEKITFSRWMTCAIPLSNFLTQCFTICNVLIWFRILHFVVVNLLIPLSKSKFHFVVNLSYYEQKDNKTSHTTNSSTNLLLNLLQIPILLGMR